MLTPATEVDGREKAVDNFNFSLKNPTKTAPGLVYWGQYVQHDNNRDGIGVGLNLTQNVLKSFLDWHPQVFHDLHESVTLLYVSTGTGPYNTVVDPIQINEWWLLAQNEMMEMAKRNVPGVWTYNFYDGWVPNYLFWIGVTHNSIGRFYETQSYRGQNYPMGALNQSREWYRPNPTPNDITWGPRANVNMQQSALLISMNNVAKNKDTFLENYYLKNKHAIERGQTKAPHAYVVPAAQRRKVEAAELMNLLRREGAEVHTANAAFTAGSVAVAAGDYIVRMDQPYGAMVETLIGVQFYPPDNPRPYDDTGWAIPLVRNVKSTAVADKSILQQPMTLATADFKMPGTISGTGPVLIVDHTTDNTLVTFRFQHAGREDVGGGAGVRARRPQVRARRVRDRQRGSRGARALDQGARPLGLGGRGGAGRPDARSRRAEDRLHPLLDQHPGRRLGPHGARQVQGAVHLLRRQPGAPGQPEAEVQRDPLPARRRRRHRTRLRRRAGQRAAAVQEDPRDAASRHPGLDRRHARRPRLRRAAGADEVRAGGRRARHRRGHRRRSSRSST